LIACLLFWSCSEDNSVEPILQNLRIISIQAPESAYQFPAVPVGIHVRADDPRGVKNLAGVQLTVRRFNAAVGNFDMRDDGANGDILPGDGQYFLPIDTSLFRSQIGDFILEAIARNLDGLESAAAHDTITIIAGRESSLPQLLTIEVPPSIAGDSSYSPIFRATANGAAPRFVRIEFFPPAFPTPTLVDSLFDDGRHEDGAAGDGVFAKAIPATNICGTGLFSIVLRAVDATGEKSSSTVTTTNVTRQGLNFPPAVSDLQAPAEISRNRPANTYLLSVLASDPNCIADLRRVFFNTFLPNGNPSSGNPFVMRDDGREGDAVSGDGRYSLTIQITPQNATGAYRFEFQAEDKKGGHSTTLTHIITVID
jgi:hypothetical protein